MRQCCQLNKPVIFQLPIQLPLSIIITVKGAVLMFDLLLNYLKSRVVVARRDTGRFRGGPLTNDFVEPRKKFKGVNSLVK